MPTLTYEIVNPERVQSEIGIHIPQRIRDQVRVAVDRISSDMERRVRANLTGGVLKVMSGRLSGAVFSHVYERPGFIGARVGVGNDGYVGRFYEKGFDGPMDVGSYTRTSIRGKAATIRARVRNMSNTHRPWLGPVVDDMRGTIRSELLAALERSVPTEI
jgi:hypothetical protein